MSAAASSLPHDGAMGCVKASPLMLPGLWASPIAMRLCDWPLFVVASDPVGSGCGSCQYWDVRKKARWPLSVLEHLELKL